MNMGSQDPFMRTMVQTLQETLQLLKNDDRCPAIKGLCKKIKCCILRDGSDFLYKDCPEFKYEKIILKSIRKKYRYSINHFPITLKQKEWDNFESLEEKFDSFIQKDNDKLHIDLMVHERTLELENYCELKIISEQYKILSSSGTVSTNNQLIDNYYPNRVRKWGSAPISVFGNNAKKNTYFLAQYEGGIWLDIARLINYKIENSSKKCRLFLIGFTKFKISPTSFKKKYRKDNRISAKQL